LITIAANEIYMVPGSIMGAATPVSGLTGEVAGEKVISAVRASFAATADVRGRNPRVAEAMVDPSVQIEGLIGSEQLLTMDTEGARRQGYTNGVVTGLDQLMVLKGLDRLALEVSSPTFLERLVEAEAQVPLAISEAFRSGNLGIMDYYRMRNMQADTRMREGFAGEDEGSRGENNSG
jgi:membrane-bound serine protease (ClpP class)